MFSCESWESFKNTFFKENLRTTASGFRFVRQSIVSSPFPLREKCPYSESFCSVFSRIRTENREILRISPYSVQMRGNTDQSNSEYGHFLGSVQDGCRNVNS